MAENGRRLVAEVTEFAVIASGTEFGDTVPGAVMLGAERVGTVELLLRFEPVWRDGPRIEQAFLLLDPLPQSRSAAEAVDVDVWRIASQWSRRDVSWLAQPELAYPKAAGIARSNGAPLRIDVTTVVEYLKQHPAHDFGLAVRATAAHPTGVPYATGAAGGAAPRIEVYGR